MILLSFIQNIALLVTLSVVHQLILRKRERDPLQYPILSGLLFGGVGIALMMTPFRFAEGIIFDGRSIVLSVAGLFGGPIVAAIAAVICGAFRMMLGGAGAIVGVLVIGETAALGVGFHLLRRKDARFMNSLGLVGFGLLVHLVMLAMMFALPGRIGRDVLHHIAMPVLLVYPLATVLVCRIFLDQEERLTTEKALRESEAKYKILAESSQTGVYIHQDDKIVYANTRFADLHGYTVCELLNTNYFDLLDPSERARVQEFRSKRLRGEDAPPLHETRKIKKDGTPLWCETVAVRIDYQGKPAIMGNIVDITERKQAEEQRDRLVSELKDALANVKTLRGLLPICAHCNKIRDGKGDWDSIETYIGARSEAKFSHGICPECAKKYYPEFDIYEDK